MQQQTKVLSVLSLVMITVGSVDSIRNLPAAALFGSSLIFFFLLAALLFLIPAAMVSAELASSWRDHGGIYLWVKEAFGPNFGFLAIWLQWVENIIWYPTILSFVAGTVGYLITPSFAHNKYFLIAVILTSFWGATLINWYGMKSSAFFSTFCTLAGSILPIILFIGLGFLWLSLDHPVAIHLDFTHLIPDLHNPQMWVALTGIMMSFCGMEIATVHAGEVKDPQKDYPKAMLIATMIILLTLLFGSLAIAIVLPHQQISLVAGVMQAFTAFFNAYHLHWLLPVIAVLLVIGGLGSVSNWIIAPTKGLLIAAQDGLLPQHLQTTNRHGAPKSLLIYQGIVVTILTLLFLFMPSINGSYWLLTALASQLYMLMYLLMFAAIIALRYQQPQRQRGFRIPGGTMGIWMVGGAGLIGCLITIAVGFMPPDNVHVGSIVIYDALLIIGLIIMLTPPGFQLLRGRIRHQKLAIV